MDAEAEDAGEIVKELWSNAVDHVAGMSDDRLKLLGAHDDVSLFVTLTV